MKEIQLTLKKSLEELTGRITFTLLKGHDKLYQSVQLPIPDIDPVKLVSKIDYDEEIDESYEEDMDDDIGGREIFAKWVPDFV